MHTPPRHFRRQGFTLIELMVCMAIVLLLILGINEVFRLTGQTIGQGQALSAALRDQRSTRSTLEDDITNAAPDGPAFIITNQVVAAFKDKADEQSNASVVDGLSNSAASNPAFIDLDGDGQALTSTPGEVVTPATPNSRLHRIDTLTFFTRNYTRRQTGNIGPNGGNLTFLDLIGNTATSEGLVSYGHLRLPDNTGTTWFDPGEPSNTDGGKTINRTNDNNKYASQWILGRRQTVLTPRILDTTSNETTWQTEATALAAPLNLTPLSMATRAVASRANANIQIPGALATPPLLPWTSHVDVAETTIASFARTLANYERDKVNGGTYTTTFNDGLWFMPAPTRAYSTTAGNVPQTLVFRTNASPFGARTDNTSGVTGTLGETLAQSAPVFIPRCTQFIVEYAGDFLTQDTNVLSNAGYGVVTATVPDGLVDFAVYNGTRRIRWYGLPRYTNSGDLSTSGAYVGPRVRGTTTSTVSTATGGPFRDTNVIADVVPLADIVAAFNNRPFRSTLDIASFEKIVMTDRTTLPTGAGTANFHNLTNTTVGSIDPTRFLPPQANYANPSAANPLTVQRGNYVCAWQGSGPKMIRITMTLEDASPRSTPQTFEYVFSLPY